MANIQFENIAAQIAAGTITAEEILQNACSALSALEKQALLIVLGQKELADNTPKTAASVQSGLFTGNGGTVIVPDFLAGSIQVIDTDNSAQADLGGTHQFVTDDGGDSYPEGSDAGWEHVAGKFYQGKTFTVPVGITLMYTFVLNA